MYKVYVTIDSWKSSACKLAFMKTYLVLQQLINHYLHNMLMKNLPDELYVGLTHYSRNFTLCMQYSSSIDGLDVHVQVVFMTL